MRLILILLSSLFLISCSGYEPVNEGDFAGHPQSAPEEEQQDTPTDQTQNTPPTQVTPTLPPPSSPVAQPERTPPSQSYNCTNSIEVECGFDISLSNWSSRARISELIRIPKGKILASKIITSNSTTAGGSFSFETPSGSSNPRTYLWISLTPGGVPLSDRCKQDYVSFIYSLKWTQFEYRSCTLAPNQVYFINLQHYSPAYEASYVKRHLSKSAQ